MRIEKFKNYKDLIPFYKLRGLEIEDDFDNKPVFSLVMKNNNEIIGAATCSKIYEDYIIEAIAISENEIRKGYGKLLLKDVLNEIELLNGNNVFLVAKEIEFFEKNGFITIDRKNAPDFSYCFVCPKYKVSCFPQVMKYIGEKR